MERTDSVRNCHLDDIALVGLFRAGEECVSGTSVGNGLVVLVVDTALNVVAFVRGSLVVVLVEEYFHGVLLIGVGTCHAQYGIGDFSQYIEVVLVPEHFGNGGRTVAHGVGVDINGVGICPCGIDVPVNGNGCFSLGCLGILGLFCEGDNTALGQCTAANRFTFIHHVKKAFCQINAIPCSIIVEYI